MGNENERKRDPAENRRDRMGHKWDDAKTGGGEKTVGLTGAAEDSESGGAGGSVGSTGVIGGSPEFLAAGESAEQEDEDRRADLGKAAAAADQGRQKG